MLKGLDEVVHGAGLIAFEDVALLFADGGDEDDGDVPGGLVRADALGRGEAVQAGHHDVHEDEREVVLGHELQGIEAAAGGDDVDPLVAQQSREQQEVDLLVVHREDVYRLHNALRFAHNRAP